MRQISFRLPHDPRPFVMSIALECWFGQRSSARLYPRGSVSVSQGEKNEGDQQRKIFVRQCTNQTGTITFVAKRAAVLYKKEK